MPWLFHVFLKVSTSSSQTLSTASPLPFSLPHFFLTLSSNLSLLCLLSPSRSPSLIPPSLLSSGPWQCLLITSCWMNMLPAHLRTISVVSIQKSTQSSPTPLRKVFRMRQLLGEKIGNGPRCKATGRERERETRWEKKDRERKKGRKGQNSWEEEGRRSEKVSGWGKRGRWSEALLISWIFSSLNNRIKYSWPRESVVLRLSLCNQLPDSFYLHKHTAVVITDISCLCKDHIFLLLTPTPASSQHLCTVTPTYSLKSPCYRKSACFIKHLSKADIHIQLRPDFGIKSIKLHR